MSYRPVSTTKILFFTALLAVIGNITGLSPACAEFQRTKIAVLDFELIGDKMETSGMGAILSEWFITGIVKSGRFDVVERAMLQKIVAEQKLSATGVIDETSAAALGKILGVKVIITGSVLKMRDTIEINSRVISVESGSIIAAENIRSGSSSDLHALVDELIAKILQNFPLTGYIVKKDQKQVIIDLGLDSGLTSGTEFIAYKEGEVIKHPKTGEVLDVVQIVTGKLRITKVSKNVAEGQILTEEPGGIEYGNLVKSVLKETGKTAAKTQGKSTEKPVVKEHPTAKEPPAQPETPKSAPEVKQETVKAEKAKTAAPVATPPVTAMPLPGPPPPPAQKEKPSAKEPAAVKELPTQPESSKSAPGVKKNNLKVEKNKTVVPVTTSPVTAESAASSPLSPAPKEPASVKDQFTGYKAAIFPFQMSGDATPFSGVLAERIISRTAEYHELTVTKSYYKLKGIEPVTNVNAKDLFSGSSPNLTLLTKMGSELGINVAILGRMDIRCKDSSAGSNNCDIRTSEVIVVNLTTGKIYSHTAPPGVRSTADDAIDEACKGVFKKFMADAKNVTEGKQESSKTLSKVTTPSVNTALPANAPPLPATKEQTSVKEQVAGYKAAIFPFQMSGDANPFSGVLAERISSRIAEYPELTVAKSYYRLKGIEPVTNVSVKELYSGSSPDLALLTKKGSELGINIAILGRMDIRCKDSSMGSNNCDIRTTEILIVNLTTGKVYSHAAPGIRTTAEDAIDEACKGVFKKFFADVHK